MRYPSIAILEFAHVATGIYAGDAMVKKAPVAVLKTGTVHNGKYLVMIGGSVAAVEEAFAEGVARSGNTLLDSVLLPNAHPQVHDAVLGARLVPGSDAVGIIETATVPAVVNAADKSLKGTNVTLVELRLADDLGGKGLAIFSGALEVVESALDLARSSVADPACWLCETLIPRLSAEMREQITGSTHFAAANLDRLPGGEE